MLPDDIIKAWKNEELRETNNEFIPPHPAGEIDSLTDQVLLNVLGGQEIIVEMYGLTQQVEICGIAFTTGLSAVVGTCSAITYGCCTNNLSILGCCR